MNDQQKSELKAILLSALASAGSTALLSRNPKATLLSALLGGTGSYALNKLGSIKEAGMPRSMYLRICKELGLNPNARSSFNIVMSEGGKRSAAKKQYIAEKIKNMVNKFDDKKLEKELSTIKDSENKQLDFLKDLI